MRLVAAIVLASFVAACGDDATNDGWTTATTATSADTTSDGTTATTASPTDATVATETAEPTDTSAEVDDDVAEDTSEPDATAPLDTTPADIPVTLVRAPGPGDVAFSELMLDPVGRSDLVAEWVELASLAAEDTLDLASCWLEDGDGHRFTFAGHGLARVRAGERFVVARAEVEGVEPDLVQGDVLLANAAGEVRFGCGEATLDVVAWGPGWPLAPGRALLVAADPSDNDEPGNACAARATYDALGPNRGTPGVVDAACPPPDVTVDACALLAPGTMTLRAGDSAAFAGLEAVAWIHEADATDLSAGIDPIPNLRGELGLAQGLAAMTWSAAAPDASALDAAHPERDVWSAPVPALDVGVWTVSFRFSLDAGETWTACGAATLTVVPSPCEPNPCTRAPESGCDGDVATASPELGACAVVDDAAACAWPVVETDCGALGGSCDAGACVDVAGPPVPGEVVVVEIMKNPNAVDDALGEWLELQNVSDRVVQLAGCELGDDTTDYVALIAPDDDVGALTLVPGAVVTLAASRDPGQNGGFAAAVGWRELGTFALDNGNDAVILTCADQMIDTVRYTTSSFPNTTGRSMQLAPRHTDATSNDLGVWWCVAQTATGGGTFPDYGTPGVANPACPEAVERCRLVAPPELVAVAGSSVEVAIQFRHPGVSDVSAGTDGDGLLRVEGGTGPAGYYPTWGGWTYVAAEPDLAWSDATAPLEDQWRATIYADPELETRDIGGRVSVDGGLSWTACDRDSGLPGGDGSQDGYTPSNATRLVIAPSDPCQPNPCTSPPDNRCDPNGLVLYPEVGTCTLTNELPTCAYPSDVFDCDALDGTCDAELGQCVGAVLAPLPGELVISEVMVSPRAVADFFGEWIELESLATVPVNLAGCTLGDSDGAVLVTVPGHALVVAPGERVVLSRQATDNGGVDALWSWGGGLGLGNVGDRVELRCDDATIDTITWDPSWPFAPGVAMQLEPDSVDATLNDTIEAWCAAMSTYGEGDLGTPGALNACP